MKLFAPNATDFYKTGHRPLFLEGTETIYSNFTPRSSKLANMTKNFSNKVVNFGLQGALKEINEMWNESFFSKPKEKVIARYKRRMDTALGPNSVDMKSWENLWDLGYLPIEVKSLPEGAIVDIKIPLFTVKNTLPEFFWVTNYLETVLSSLVWKSMTNATIAFEYKKMLDNYANLTSSYPPFTIWQGHDFSARGMSGPEDAARSGAAHMAVGFTGTDTVSAIDYLEDYYNADADKGLVGGSVVATEHSLSSQNILVIEKTKNVSRSEAETIFIRDLITNKVPVGIVSVVADTFDFFNVITNTAKVLKPEIEARQVNALGLAKVVFRPDSGDPTKIICGDPQATKGSPENKGAIETLWETFGGTVNSRGFKELNPRVGIIYGDSITLQRAEAILSGLAEKGFASTNVVFGIGSFTYQHNTRDTFGCAIKATYSDVNDSGYNLMKDPVTDKGSVKKSAEGLLRVEKVGNNFVLFDKQTKEQEATGELKTIYLNGKLVKETTLAEIRENVRNS